jgi:hypothetical protein
MQVNLRVSASVFGCASVTLRTIFPLPFTVGFLSFTTNGVCEVQTFPVLVGMSALRFRFSARRLLRANGSLCGLAPSLSLGFLRSKLAAWVGEHVKRPSVTLRHVPTRKVHCPGVVSASQLGSLSMQVIFPVGKPVFGSFGGCGVIAHSTWQSCEPFPTGTQSATLATVPDEEHTACARCGAAVSRASMPAHRARRTNDLMTSSSIDREPGWGPASRDEGGGDGNSRGNWATLPGATVVSPSADCQAKS